MGHQCDYMLELTFTGPMLSQASGVLAFGVDSAMQRYQGKPVLSGSLIRGNIRHAMKAFSQDIFEAESTIGAELNTNITRWFGTETTNNTYTPNRAEIDFDFFWKLDAASENNAKKAASRTRIKLEEDSGKVEIGALQVIEDCFPSGSLIVFTGQIHGRFLSGKEQKLFTHWLAKALDYIPAMGSFKGVGFGKLATWELTEQVSQKHKKASQTKGTPLPDGKTRIGITLKLDRPFCLGRPRTPDSNRIVSDEVISGHVIKGVIARQYQKALQKELSFDELIISHAIPVPDPSARPSPLPLSLAQYDGSLMDMSLSTAKDTWNEAPRFKPDWKESEKQQAETEWGSAQHPVRYLTIRTEIMREKGISQESRLFTLECIDPTDFIWCADIELCNIEESRRPAVYSQLQSILQKGLTGIGKTKARATVSLVEPFKHIKQTLEKSADNCYIVTLQTDARLLPADLQLSGVNSHNVLKTYYQTYWHQQHPAITLLNYFAQQQLTSTYYHQRKNNQANDYHPEWLTTAGSVFVLEINDEKAMQQLQQWDSTGLPAHNNPDGSEANWQSTPFLPEHGYGEIIINDPRQRKLLHNTNSKHLEEGA